MSIYHFGLLIILIKQFEVLSIMYRRIRELREDKDLLQKDIAKLLNCSQVAYSRYELGLRDIPTDVLITLAKFHNTSVDYILGITDDKNPYRENEK